MRPLFMHKKTALALIIILSSSLFSSFTYYSFFSKIPFEVFIQFTLLQNIAFLFFFFLAFCFQEKKYGLSNNNQNLIATLSHEIKNHLSTISGMSELLAESKMSPAQKTYNRAIKESTYSLLQLMNETLDQAKLQQKKIKLYPQKIDLKEYLQRICLLFEERAKKKGLIFNLHLEEISQKKIFIDPFRLEQVLLNLLSNSLKFTEKGSITITAQTKSMGNEDILKILIEDTGIGMTKKQSKRIFKEFKQAEETTFLRYGGTGLGLSICKYLIESMGGAITVKSELDEGSLFSLRIPLSRKKEIAASQESHLLQQISKESLRILVAEDLVLNQELLRVLFKSLNLKVYIVSHGLEALEALRNRSFDLVFLDLQMPEIDGITVCQNYLNQQASRNKNLPWFVALTAYSLDETKKKCFKVGFQDYIEKPLSKEKLYLCFESYFQKRELQWVQSDKALKDGY